MSLTELTIDPLLGTGVVRWFAERADIVLLFFDPDKPGTTGETLSTLLHSLGGMDHKLLIVLNKADQFEKVSKVDQIQIRLHAW